MPLGGNGSVVAPLSDGRSSSLVPLSLGRPFGGPLGNGLSRARSDIVVGCTVSRLPGRSSVLGDLAARGLDEQRREETRKNQRVHKHGERKKGEGREGSPPCVA